MIVTLAGHVDHGKTSIVRTLTGVDTDRLAEEKRRGLTIDLGFAYTEIGGGRIGFVDVPGHHRFIHNMVAGVAGRQFALLVVAADDGVMPQSREHLQILRLLGLRRGLVALNKTDRVDPERVATVRRDILALTAGSFLDGADIVELSCETGLGFDTLRDRLGEAADRQLDTDDVSPFRLAIDRAFTIRGSGVVVTGTVASGRAAVDDRLALGSTGAAVRIRGLHVQDEPAATTSAGDRAAINIAGVDTDDVVRGDWLLDPAVREPCSQFAVALNVVDDFPRRVKHNAPVHAYHATSHAHGRLLLLDSAPVAAGATALVDVACETPLHVKVGDRVVFRDHDLERTLGGGRVLDFYFPRTRRRNTARRQRLADVQPQDPTRTLTALARVEALETETFARRWNLKPAAVDRLANATGLVDLADHWLHPALVAQTTHDMDEALTRHHRDQPDSEGLTAEELLGVSGGSAAQRLVLAKLVDDGTLQIANGRYANAGHNATIPDPVRRLFDVVGPLLDSAQPPSLGDIAKRLKRPFRDLEQEMRALPAFGLVARISDSRYYLPNRLLELADIAADLDGKGPFTVRQFRDATGVGRNVVIEVLEHFDAKGFTRRQGDARRIVGERATIVTR